jgi:hypothetical protein
MFFAAIIISTIVAGLVRGCAKYFVIVALFAFVAYKDPVLAQKVSELFNQAVHELREWIVSLPS